MSSHDFLVLSAIYILIGLIIISSLRSMTRWIKARYEIDPDRKDKFIAFQFCVILMLTLLVWLYDTSLTRFSSGVTYLDLMYNMSIIHIFGVVIIFIISIQYLVLLKEFITQ